MNIDIKDKYVILYLSMAKKKKDSAQIDAPNTQEESQELLVEEKKETKKPNPEDSLSPEERKKYRKAVKALRRSEWLEEYWIITILSIIVLALMIALTIGKAIHDKKLEEEYEEELEQVEEEDNPLEQTEEYNIKEQMELIL